MVKCGKGVVIMSKTSEWIKEHPKGISFKCNCGATVVLKVWEDKGMVLLSARCWKCNKELTLEHSKLLIDCAGFDMLGKLVEEFQNKFNKDGKSKTIRVVK